MEHYDDSILNDRTRKVADPLKKALEAKENNRPEEAALLVKEMAESYRRLNQRELETLDEWARHGKIKQLFDYLKARRNDTPDLATPAGES